MNYPLLIGVLDDSSTPPISTIYFFSLFLKKNKIVYSIFNIKVFKNYFSHYLLFIPLHTRLSRVEL